MRKGQVHEKLGFTFLELDHIGWWTRKEIEGKYQFQKRTQRSLAKWKITQFLFKSKWKLKEDITEKNIVYSQRLSYKKYKILLIYDQIEWWI